MAAWPAALRVLARDFRAGPVGGADWPGAALVTGALMLTVYVIAGDRGPAATAALAALALALLVAFAVRQARADRPCCGCGSCAPGR